MTAALAWAPLIPPSPDVTSTWHHVTHYWHIIGSRALA